MIHHNDRSKYRLAADVLSSGWNTYMYTCTLLQTAHNSNTESLRLNQSTESPNSRQ